jgi:Protein of unknown function (DUF1194)
MRPPLPLCLALALTGAVGATDATTPTRPGVDFAIVTAIDGSDSVSGAEMRLQLTGLAEAMRNPDVLAAIHGGGTGRAGFAMFVWHERQFEVVPWTLIATEADAETVARTIEARLAVHLDEEARKGPGMFIGRLTDLSAALDHARALLAAAPFDARRTVVNVLANGSDNMGEAAAPARDRLLAVGATINGVALGGDPELPAYFRTEVAGGADSFVMQAPAAHDLADMLRRKFLRDLVAAIGASRG